MIGFLLGGWALELAEALCRLAEGGGGEMSGLTARQKLRRAMPSITSFERYWTRRRKDTAPMTAMSTAGYYYAEGYTAGRKAARRERKTR